MAFSYNFKKKTSQGVQEFLLRDSKELLEFTCIYQDRDQQEKSKQKANNEDKKRVLQLVTTECGSVHAIVPFEK